MPTGSGSSKPTCSVAYASRHYLRGMRQRNWGRVVFVSSESAVQIPAEMIHYGMTKTAQLAISRGLAETLAGTGVTVARLGHYRSRASGRWRGDSVRRVRSCVKRRPAYDPEGLRAAASTIA